MTNDTLKTHIADSFKLLVLEQSVTKITISQIAKQANISRRNFYNHFKDKYELMEWMYLQDINDEIQQYSAHDIWKKYYVLCAYMYEERDYYINILTDKSQNSFYQFMISRLTDTLIEIFGQLYEVNNASKKLISTIILLQFEEAYEWLKYESHKSAEVFCKERRDNFNQVMHLFNPKHWEDNRNETCNI